MFSCTHARSLAGTGHPNHAAKGSPRHARAFPVPPRVRCPSPEAPAMHVYPVTSSRTCLPLCRRTQLDAAGNPSLAIVNSPPAAKDPSDPVRPATPGQATRAHARCRATAIRPGIGCAAPPSRPAGCHVGFYRLEAAYVAATRAAVASLHTP
jgi:hypothetical protein